MQYVVEMDSQIYGPFDTADFAFYWLSANSDQPPGKKGLVRGLRSPQRDPTGEA